ncbi:Uncharacterised protein [Halioglobus japonicus]|nr:Uncharacterised protein [Halioglobus japonicus]
MENTEDEFHTLVEVEEAIYSLTPVEIIGLKQFAHARLVFCSSELSADELISEAVARSLEETRRWNLNLTIVQHLIGVMRSLAGDQRRTSQAKTDRLAGDVVCQQMVTIEDRSVDFTEIVHGQALLSVIFNAFHDDGHSMKVLEGMLEGETRQEIMSKSRLSEQEYGAARKRITRKMVQMRDGGQI